MNSLKRLVRLTLVSALLVGIPTLSSADYSELVCSIDEISGTTVTVNVHNPAGYPNSGRVRVTVRLVDDSSETLTSGGVTVPGNGTKSAQLLASQPVSVILEGPEPLPY